MQTGIMTCIFTKSKITRQLQKEEVHLLEQINSLRGGKNGRTMLKRPGELAPAVPLFGCKNALAAPGQSVL